MQSCILPRPHNPYAKAILDVPLCHENFVVVIGLSKGMHDATKGIAQLIQGSLGRHFHRGVADRIKETAILEAKAERQV
jgi:hypothetical protein